MCAYDVTSRLGRGIDIRDQRVSKPGCGHCTQPSGAWRGETEDVSHVELRWLHAVGQRPAEPVGALRDSKFQ